MSNTKDHRPHSVVTRRGLEVTVPTPAQIPGCLVPFVLFLGMALVFPIVLAHEFIDGLDGVLRTIDRTFGWWWLGLGAVMTVLTIAFSGLSNRRVVFGHRTLRFQERLGEILMGEDEHLLSAFARVEVQKDLSGSYWLQLYTVSGRRYARIGPMSERQAIALQPRIQQWLDAPGSLPVEQARRERTPALIAASAISVVSGRLMLVIPTLIAAAGMLLLATAWQIREAQAGRAEPFPRLDRVTDGRLLSYRWHIHTPALDTYGARAYLQIAIEYVADDGVARTLWLRSRRAPPLYELPHGPLRQAAERLGVTTLEFVVPDWTRDALAAGATWAEWKQLARSPAHTRPEVYRAATLLTMLDRPLHHLAAQAAAPEPDWRVAYRAAAPERAMPLWWAEAEREAMRQVPEEYLLIVGVAASLLIYWTLPGLVSSPLRRRRGRLAVLAVLLTLPWWAGYAERAAGHLGAGEWMTDRVLDVLRIGVLDELRAHEILVRVHEPAAQERGVPLRWTAERSAAAALLPRLGLIPEPGVMPHADSAALVGHLRSRVATTLGALDDDALAAFVADYEGRLRPARDGDVHRELVAPVLCRLVAERHPAIALSRSLARELDCTAAARTVDDASTSAAEALRSLTMPWHPRPEADEPRTKREPRVLPSRRTGRRRPGNVAERESGAPKKILDRPATTDYTG
jgi:hypothetical protein